MPFSKHPTSKCDAYYKSDHNLTVTDLKCIWNKYANNETIVLTSSSVTYTAIYNNGSYLMYMERSNDKALIVYR